MSTNASSLVVHVGYPKTATTTFQQHVFPQHPEIHYLGKYIPSFRYRHDDLAPLLNDLAHKNRLHYKGTEALKSLIDRIRLDSQNGTILLSSESFIHPWASDIAMVADRLYEAFWPCKILITIREQISALLSFYWMHGRYGQYLSIGGRDENRRLSTPLSFSQWIKLQKTAEDKNYISTLHYDKVILYYLSRFGSANLEVLTFETLKSNPKSYVEKLSDFLGVDSGMMSQLAAGRHEHASTGRNDPWDSSQWDQIRMTTSRVVISRLRRKLAALILGEVAGAHPDSLRAVVDDLRGSYRKGNAILADRLSLPLKEHGYSL